MPSAVADFPDRAPPSTSTRRRPTRGVAGEGVALAKLIGAAGGGPGLSAMLIGAAGGGPGLSAMLIGWAGGGPGSSAMLMGGAAGDGAPRDSEESGEGGAAGGR